MKKMNVKSDAESKPPKMPKQPISPVTTTGHTRQGKVGGDKSTK